MQNDPQDLGKRGFEDGNGEGGFAKRQAVGDGVGTGDAANVAFKILVPARQAGGLIGKGGATISGIKDSSGARVKVSTSQEVFPGTTDRIVLISGTLEAVLTASRLVISEIFRIANRPPLEAEDQTPEVPPEQQVLQITVVIPAAACGTIIGKGGERINTLREQSQCKVMLQSKDKIIQGLDERVVNVHGHLVNSQMAVEKIIMYLYEEGSNIHYNNMSTKYGAFAAPGMPGMHGAVPGMPPAPAAYHPYGAPPPAAYPYGAPAYDPNAAAYGYAAPGYAPPVPAPTMPGVPDGAQMTMKLAIPEMTVGLLVGKGGCIIKELMQLSGAQIKVSQKGDVVPGTTNRIVTINGAPTAANYAHMLVLQKVPTATALAQ